MNIHQINMQFNAEEDRIWLRLNTSARDEFRFSLTRRFVKRLWPVLVQLLEKEFKTREPQKAHAAKDMVSFEREHALSAADFSKQYESEERTYPLGEAYELLTKLNVTHNDEGNMMLAFFTEHGQGIQLGASASFLHIFCDLLRKTVQKAEWDLIPNTRPDSGVGENKKINRILH